MEYTALGRLSYYRMQQKQSRLPKLSARADLPAPR